MFFRTRKQAEAYRTPGLDKVIRATRTRLNENDEFVKEKGWTVVLRQIHHQESRK